MGKECLGGGRRKICWEKGSDLIGKGRTAEGEEKQRKIEPRGERKGRNVRERGCTLRFRVIVEDGGGRVKRE